MGKLKSYQEQLQDIVEKGINAAEEPQKKSPPGKPRKSARSNWKSSRSRIVCS